MDSPQYQILEISDSESVIDTTGLNDQQTDYRYPVDNGDLVLDLTADEYRFINDIQDDKDDKDDKEVIQIDNNKDKANIPGSSIDNSISLDDDTYAFFIEAGLEDPEELTMLGINIDEIRAQKSLVERLEMENKVDYELAIRLQRDMEMQDLLSQPNGPATASSSTSTSSSCSSGTPIHPIFNQHFITPQDIKNQTSSIHPSSIKREINTVNNEQSRYLKRAKMESTAYAYKGKSPIEIPDDIDKGKKPIELIDDVECIDLTDDNDGSLSAYYSTRQEYEYNNNIIGGEDEDETLSLYDYLSQAPWNLQQSSQEPVNRPVPSQCTGNSGGSGWHKPDFRLNYGIPPVNTNPIYQQAMERMRQLTNNISPMNYTSQANQTNRSQAYAILQQSHMDDIANLELRRTLPRLQTRPTPVLSQAETEKELRDLLEHVVYDDPPPPQDRTGTPDGLSITLLEHQKIGLQWMCKMESSNNKGGILADDMGLGKTIQALAVIVQNPCHNATEVDHSIIARNTTEVATGELQIKATLIVCPVSLMDQWRREIENKTEPRLKVLVYHGGSRTNNPYDLALYDVIISSYSITAGNYHETCKGPFSKVKFHRVILDEAHTIKNKQTVGARGCCQIDATYRWCMTATPIQNKIDELYSLIRFLRIRPFCEWDDFRDTIVKPMKDGNHKKAIKVAQVLMKAISLRRSKKALIDGRPILNLPERNINMTHIDFSPDERIHYDFVNQRAQARFTKYMQQGTVMKNYSSVLVLLLRLRQACLHPSLTVIEGDGEANPEAELSLVRSMKPEVVRRLLSESTSMAEIECPICMDVAQDAQIIKACGHILCKECCDSYINANDGSTKRCPQCRGDMSKQSLVGIEAFLKVYAPELIKEANEADEEEKKAENRVKEFVSSAKIDKMLEILEDTNADTNGQDKTIVFSQFTGFLDLIGQPLKDRGHKFLRYDGSMDIKSRADTVNKFFEDPSYKVMLVSTKCGSLGLNLTIANRVILMDVWWNPALENQAIDRVHRIGQKKRVDVHRIFINDTVEDRILELQNKKQQIADGVLGEGSGKPISRLGLQEMIYLFRGGDVPDPGADAGPSNRMY